jgi:GxxExxY protein
MNGIEMPLAQRRGGAELKEISGKIVDIGLSIHKILGPGLLESVYEAVLSHELRAQGLQVERQVALPVRWKGLVLDDGFRADLIVESSIIVELKSVERTQPVHKKQLLTYLRLTGLSVGLLLNFGTELFRDGIERVVNGAPE